MKNSSRSKLLWSLLFFVIAALSVYAIVSQSRSFTLDTFMDYLERASVPYVLCAFACMLGFIFFEGEAVRSICRAFDCGSGHKNAFAWSASDIYFSAITPSATGGQPACAYFMIKDGVPPLISTISLLVNLTMYTFSIIVLGALALVLQPNIFAAFGTVSKVLITVGMAIQLVLGAFFIMLIVNERLLHRICRGGLHILCSLKLLRREEERQKKLSEHMSSYAEYSSLIMSHRPALIKSFVLNLLQRLCVLCVPFFLCLASGGGIVNALRVWAVQCMTVLGSNAVPIPGAMGVSDYLMLDGFGSFIPHRDVVDFELLSRAISFYICVLLCGAVTLIKYLIIKKRERQL